MAEHYSNPRCDDCGTRHAPGHRGECIEALLVASRCAREDEEDTERQLREAKMEIDRLRAIVDSIGDLVPDYTWPEEYVRQIRAAVKAAKENTDG